MFNVNNKDSRKKRHWCRSGIFVNFEHVSHLVLAFLLLNLNMLLPAGLVPEARSLHLDAWLMLQGVKFT